MKLFFVCASMLIHLSTYAQKEVTPGYIVSLQGDTTRGRVNYLNWNKNPKQISFITEAGISMNCTPANVKAVNIAGKDFYQGAVITRSTRSIQISELSPNTGDMLVTDTIFLRQLVSGTWNLFEFTDFKDHYYLQVNGGPITELYYEISVADNSNNFTERNIFRDQLNVNLMGTQAESQVAANLGFLKYSERELTNFVESVNQANTGHKNLIYKDKRKIFSFYGGVAVMFDGFKASGNSAVQLTHINFKGSIRPGIQAGIEFTSARRLQKLMIRAELQYYSFQVSGNGQMQKPGTYDQLQLDYLLSASTFKPSVNVFYKVVKKPTFDVFVGAGLGENFSSYPKDRMTVTDTALNSRKIYDNYGAYYSHWSQFTASAGVTVRDRFEAVLVLPLFGNFTRFVMVSAKPSIISVQLNYKFKRN